MNTGIGIGCIIISYICSELSKKVTDISKKDLFNTLKITLIIVSIIYLSVDIVKIINWESLINNKLSFFVFFYKTHSFF